MVMRNPLRSEKVDSNGLIHAPEERHPSAEEREAALEGQKNFLVQGAAESLLAGAPYVIIPVTSFPPRWPDYPFAHLRKRVDAVAHSLYFEPCAVEAAYVMRDQAAEYYAILQVYKQNLPDVYGPGVYAMQAAQLRAGQSVSLEVPASAHLYPGQACMMSWIFTTMIDQLEQWLSPQERNRLASKPMDLISDSRNPARQYAQRCLVQLKASKFTRA